MTGSPDPLRMLALSNKFLLNGWQLHAKRVKFATLEL